MDNQVHGVKSKLNCFRDGWFVFDSALVALMVAETWVIAIMQSQGSSGGGSILADTAILRLFRLLRLSRLMRMLRSLPELMILVKGMMTAMRSVMYVMGLLVIITYVFAIAFTLLSDGYEFKETFFSSVPESIYSLFVYGIFLDNLADFCNDIREESPICIALVFVFIMLACMTVLNMLIGVLCEVISAVAAIEKEENLTHMVKDTIGSILHSLDSDKDGSISYLEFKKILEYPQALRALQEAGVDPAGIVDFADLFFIEDGEPIELSFERFMELVLDLRGSNNATVKDIMTLWKQISPRLIESTRDLQAIQDRAAGIERTVGSSTKRIEGRLDDLLTEVRQLARRQVIK